MKRVCDFVIGAFIVSAVCIAGSDGPYFPWLNFAAVAWLGAAAWVGKRALKMSR